MLLSDGNDNGNRNGIGNRNGNGNENGKGTVKNGTIMERLRNGRERNGNGTVTKELM